jgi:hypothetical protein
MGSRGKIPCIIDLGSGERLSVSRLGHLSPMDDEENKFSLEHIGPVFHGRLAGSLVAARTEL